MTTYVTLKAARNKETKFNLAKSSEIAMEDIQSHLTLEYISLSSVFLLGYANTPLYTFQPLPLFHC